MKRYVRRHRVLTATIVLCLAIGAWLFLPASTRGNVVARFDIMRGHYEMQSCGRPPKWQDQYAGLLRERGIHLRAVAGCMISEPIMSYVGAYNTTMRAAAEKRFGYDVIQECEAEARRSWDIR